MNSDNFQPTRWGSYYTILHYDKYHRTHAKLKRLLIDGNKNISYQRHLNRSEIWHIFGGSGELVVDGEITKLSVGDMVIIPVGSWHSVKASEEGLEVIEVQFGERCEEEDIERKYYEWSDIRKEVVKE